MRISVITAAFNSAGTLSDTIRSVRAQTYGELEYIVVDGGSKDTTRELVASHNDLINAFVSEPDQGMYDALNKALKIATGDVVGTLNSDDCYAAPDVLQAVASAFEEQTTGACYGDLVYVARDDPTRIVRYWKSGHQRPGMIERGWFPPHPTFFVRRELYERYGEFDLSFGSAADVELMIRLLGRHRIRATYIPRVLVRMRLGGVSNRSMRNVVAQNIHLYRAFKKNRLRYSPLFPIYKLPSRMMQFVSRPGSSK